MAVPQVLADRLGVREARREDVAVQPILHLTRLLQVPGGEAGVMRIKGTGTPGHERGLAMALDGNGRWCYLDPKLGAMHAVAEAARKVACTGAVPVAATNCLNFGNPEKPEIMAQLSSAIDGIAEACTALGTPITCASLTPGCVWRNSSTSRG